MTFGLRDSRDSKRGKRDKRENLIPGSPCSDHDVNDVKWMVQVMCYVDERNVSYVFCEKHSWCTYLCTYNVNSCEIQLCSSTYIYDDSV